MLRSLFRLLSPAGAQARLSVLIFHRVLALPDPLFPDEVDAQQFDRICRWLQSWFSVLPLDEAVRRLKAGTLPSRALAITFDDGYADNHRVALRILQRHRLCATFFIATGYLDGGRMWNDTVIESVRRTEATSVALATLPCAGLDMLALGSIGERRLAIDALIGAFKYEPPHVRVALTDRLTDLLGVTPPTDLMLTADEVRGLRRAGMQIGAHTVTHPILANLDPSAAREEIGTSKRHLEELLGEPVGLFAYPNGKLGQDFTSDSVAIARDLGFDAAVTTAWGAADRATDQFQLPRFTPWDRAKYRFGARLARNLLPKAEVV